LSINGKQPIISENPDIISKSDMTIDPVSTKKCTIEINRIVFLDESIDKKTVQS
jgi:hypothetical protein